MLWAIGFLITFLFGGLTGVILASPPLDFHVSDSYFVVAHFHYVVFGTVVFAMFAGFYFWWPKMTGRMLDERLGKMHFWLLFIGFHGTFLVQHWLGVEGMPRRYADYLPAGRLHHAEPVLDGRRVRPGRLDAAVPLQRLDHARTRRWSRSTTPGAGAARWSGRPPARRRGTTSSRSRGSVRVAGLRPAPPGDRRVGAGGLLRLGQHRVRRAPDVAGLPLRRASTGTTTNEDRSLDLCVSTASWVVARRTG